MILLACIFSVLGTVLVNTGFFFKSSLPFSSKPKHKSMVSYALCGPSYGMHTGTWAELLSSCSSFITFRNKGSTQTQETTCILSEITTPDPDNITIIANRLWAKYRI